MKLRLATLFLAALCCRDGWAGNGSNYIHLINGLDYFLLMGPYTGAPGARGLWRCFPGEVLHAPTKVVDPGDPNFGTYAAKICAVHLSVAGSPSHLLSFPNITLTASTGNCHFTQSAGSAPNFGIASTGAGTGLAVIGPLSGNGVPATLQTLSITGLSLFNPAPSPNVVLQIAIVLASGGSTSFSVPDGSALNLWAADDNTQTGVGQRTYWTMSSDERNLCSGYSFLLSSGGASGSMLAFQPSLEWSMGIGTIDATMTNFVTVAQPPSGAHGNPATFAQPFDAGSGARTVSITGTGKFPATSTAGEIFGVMTYDTTHPLNGSTRLVSVNMWGMSAGGPVCSNRAPGFTQLATGGPGGPVLSTDIPEHPRLVGKIDSLSLSVLSNPYWITAMGHSTVPGGNNIPWFASPALGPGGSTGNTGGVALKIPPVSSVVGMHMFLSSVALNANGNAIARTINAGHSHSNGVDVLFFP